MTSDSFPAPVFMKNFLSPPSSRRVVIFDAEAELMPPPMDETEVLDGSRPRREMMAESTFMVDVANVLQNRDSIEGLTCRRGKKKEDEHRR
jgi:hypothetical protein